MHALLILLLAAQSIAAIVALIRLLPGIRRPAPPLPSTDGPRGAITVVVPTLNEAERIAPCLDGLMAQSDVVARILVVDSRSTDATPEIVRDAATRDPRVVLLTDTPPPQGWIGKAWALQHAFTHVETPWLLAIDADTVPRLGLAGGVLRAAATGRYDVVSFAPRFIGMTPAERFVQPAILATLVYRTGVPGQERQPSRVLANGQCFLARRDLVEAAGGYSSARASWSDDVTLARTLASRGARVGFLDGAQLYDVYAYGSFREMWREWGRSVDLSDANTRVRQWADLVLLLLVQALPLWVVVLGAGLRVLGDGFELRSVGGALLSVNAFLLVLRLGLHAGLARSYEERGLSYWVSPLADVAAVWRIVLSTVRRPKRWRGRGFDV